MAITRRKESKSGGESNQCLSEAVGEVAATDQFGNINPQLSSSLLMQ
jgi:hypothetical protein